MKIVRIRIENFKGFQDSGWVDLAEHINVVVGQNNSGKSAFLEAFKLGRAGDQPHNSPDFPEGSPQDPKSTFGVDLQVTGADLREVALKRGGQVHVAVSPGDGINRAERAFDRIFSAESIQVKLRAAGSSEFEPREPLFHDVFESWDPETKARANVIPNRSGFHGFVLSAGQQDHIPALCGGLAAERIYVFTAERAKAAICGVEDTEILRPDATNLPAVLLKLQKNPAAMARYIGMVQRVLPVIKSVSVSQTQNHLEVFTYALETERADLAVSLANSGTGVAQVLAILYVVLRQRDGCIVIDEPNSFLHPGATKKLMQILRASVRHQFVVATHSPEVIASLQPDRLLFMQWDGKQSVIKQSDQSAYDSLRDVLWEVGASLSDVFGSDAIVWVEGATELECFPLLLEGADFVALGVVFAAINTVSDFETRRRDPEELVRIHRRLAEGNALVPPGVAFGFDRETRSEQRIRDLERAFDGLAKFLPRRMYENYLLDPDALAAVISDSDLGVVHTSESVSTSIQKNIQAPEFLDTPKAKTHPARFCNAAKLLKRVFSEVSETRVEYRKTDHALKLTRWLLQHKPDELQELVAYVASLVPDRYRVTREPSPQA